MSQLSFAALDHRNEKKQTKRERFPGEMDTVVPWATLLGLVEPHYPKAGNGRRPYALDVMPRIYVLQQWYQLSDPGAEEALYDIQSMRAFARLDLGRDAIPDEPVPDLIRDPQLSPPARSARADQGDLRGGRLAPRRQGCATQRRDDRQGARRESDGRTAPRG